ncbi:Integral membrane protein OS=Streptomyces microflavus OX=1919 GN=Smic_49430 PE=4 SV=1 [Streptomyces microflavus]
MSTPGPRRARLLAAGYIGLVTAAALAQEIAGQPEGGRIPLTLATFPGGTLLVVLYNLSPPLPAGGRAAEEAESASPPPFDTARGRAQN